MSDWIVIQEKGEVKIVNPREKEIDERVFYRSLHPTEQGRPRRSLSDEIAIVISILIMFLAFIGIMLVLLRFIPK